MADIDVKLHKRQREIFDDPHRFKIVSCGRRFGKTHMAAFMIITIALMHPNGMSWMIAPTFPLSKILWRKTLALLKSKQYRRFVVDIKEGELFITFKNGHTVWCKSADKPETLVGEGLDFVVLDEFGTMKDRVWFESIRPALMDRGGGALFIGTPKGKNSFWRLFKRGKSTDAKDWQYASFQYSSHENPILKPDELEEITEDMPELLYRQEILAEFIDDGGTVFTGLSKVLRDLPDAIDTSQYVIFGLDLGKKTDFTVLVGYDYETRMPVYYRRLTRNMAWDSQAQVIEDSIKPFANYTLFVDSTGVGEPVFDGLVTLGLNVIGVNITAGRKASVNRGEYNVPKSFLIEGMCFDIECGQFFIPNFKEVKDEFESFEYYQTSTGIRYSAPSGEHDDTVLACAIARFGLGNSAAGIGFFEPEKETEYDKDYDYHSDIGDFNMLDDVADWDECVL